MKTAMRSLVVCVVVLAANNGLALDWSDQDRAVIYSQNWELGIQNWSVSNGTWQVGMPTVVGPDSAHGGYQCAGTVINGNYPAAANTRLVSPPMSLPTTGTDEYILLRFWQWFSMWTNDDDDGYVEVSADGGTTWDTVGGPSINSSPVWTQCIIDLTSYAGSTVRIAFHFTSNSNDARGSGWYIDDVAIERTTWTFSGAEDFEDGIDNWSADRGNWEAGQPGVGPDTVSTDHWCAATLLNANYPAMADSRLVSPPLRLLPQQPSDSLNLKFCHWFSMWTNDNDYGYVEISANGGATWQTIVGPFNNSSGGWTQSTIDLTAYTGSTVRIAFHFKSNDNAASGPGWYIDNVRISGMASESCCLGRMGNIAGENCSIPNMADLTVLIDHLFISLSPLECMEEGDLDLSGQPNPGPLDVTMGDLTMLIDNLFISLKPLPLCP